MEQDRNLIKVMAQGEMTAVVLGVMLAPGFGEEQECMPINRYRK